MSQNVLACCSKLVIFFSLSGCVISWRNIKTQFGVDRITGNLYAMEVASMTLVSKRATIMSQVRTLAWVISQYPSQVFSLPSMADHNLTLPGAESTQVPQADRVVI